MSVNLVKFRCNRIGCKRTANHTATWFTGGRAIVDDPRCPKHAQRSIADHVDGDVRTMARAVVDVSVMSECGDIAELIID